MSLSFITGIQFTKSMLKTINGITFLFDATWEPGRSEVATFPAAFFHIKSIHEVIDAEVSQRQMLFYNSQKETSDAVTVGSVMNIVADNVVIKPKQYKMDVIIPYDDITLLSGLSNPALSPYHMTAVTSTLLHGGKKDKQGALTKAFLVMANPYINILKTLLKSMFTVQNFAGTGFAPDGSFIPSEEWITSIMSIPDYNKNSLEEMFYSRSILKLKLWNSWRYKYVVISNMDITKEGTNDGVYEASITLQEMPILTVRPDAGTKQRGFYNQYQEDIAKKVKEIINGKEDK